MIVTSFFSLILVLFPFLFPGRFDMIFPAFPLRLDSFFFPFFSFQKTSPRAREFPFFSGLLSLKEGLSLFPFCLWQSFFSSF